MELSSCQQQVRPEHGVMERRGIHACFGDQNRVRVFMSQALSEFSNGRQEFFRRHHPIQHPQG